MLLVAQRRNGAVEYPEQVGLVYRHLQYNIHLPVVEQQGQANAVDHGRFQVVGHYRHRPQKRIRLARQQKTDSFAKVGRRHRGKVVDRVQQGVLVWVITDNGHPATFQV